MFWYSEALSFWCQWWDSWRMCTHTHSLTHTKSTWLEVLHNSVAKSHYHSVTHQPSLSCSTHQPTQTHTHKCCWRRYRWCYLTEFWSLSATRKCLWSKSSNLSNMCPLHKAQQRTRHLTHTYTHASQSEAYMISITSLAFRHCNILSHNKTVCAADHRFCWPETQRNVTISQGNIFRPETHSQRPTLVNPPIMLWVNLTQFMLLSCLKYLLASRFFPEIFGHFLMLWC